MSLSDFADRVIRVAEAIEEFPRLPARDLFDRIIQVEIERSNQRMFRTRGKSIQEK